MAKNIHTTPVKIAVAFNESTKMRDVEPETVQFAAELAAAIRKAHKPVFTKKLQALNNEYASAVMSNEEAFAQERISLEARYEAVRAKNRKEFLEKVQVLKDTYGIH